MNRDARARAGDTAKSDVLRALSQNGYGVVGSVQIPNVMDLRFWIWLKTGRFQGLGGPGGALKQPKEVGGFAPYFSGRF